MSETLTVERGQPVADAKIRRNTFLLVFLLGLVLYLGLHSTNYDGNDLIEMEAVKAADSQIFSPNHLAYRPLVLLVDRAFQIFGYTGNEIAPAHLVITISAALALALIYYWMTRLVKSNTIALLTALGFGVSWSFWVYSISVMYFVAGILPVAGALNVLWMIWDRPKAESSRRLEIVLGLLTAAAILFWEAHIFLIPLVVFALWLKYRSSRAFISSALAYLVAAGALVGFAFIGASLIVIHGNWSISALFDWLFNYGSQRLYTWGVLDFSRVFIVPGTQAASILPIWDGLGLRDLLHGELRPDKLPGQAALAALVLIVAVPLVILFVRRLWSHQKLVLLGLLIVGYLIYMPFIVWWDPTEPMWFMVPNIALWAILGVLWYSIARLRYTTVIYGVLVAVLALGNFTTSIWPRHANPNSVMATAACVATNTTRNDLVVSATWTWIGYSSYFFDQPLYNLIGSSAQLGSPNAALAGLSLIAQEVRKRGGTVYVQDVNQFDPDYYQWLTDNTGLTQAQLVPLQGEEAFTCGTIRFNKLAANS